MNKTLEKRISKKIRKIEIRTKKLVESAIGGKYTSAFRGLGIEFNKVREYEHGDDITSVDWNVTARTADDRLYIKEFIEERELQVFLVVDTSASMVYSSLKTGEDDQAPLKIDIAAEIAAVLAMSAIKNNDKVGLMTFSGAVHEYIPPKKGKRHVLHIIRDILSNAQASGETKLSSTLENLYKLIKSKAVIFIITDFMLGQQDDYAKPLSILSKKHDCIVVRISDPFEEEFPDVGLVNLVDPETGREILIDSSSSSYRRAFKARVDSEREFHKKILTRASVDILDVRTDADYIPVLYSFFKLRSKKR
ncbi:DUF58 domain-containing protein [candidate division WOR-3 bacterium]|nr:DUF58 domain-containing protein [candidate division WOR-3 bacterium]